MFPHSISIYFHHFWQNLKLHKRPVRQEECCGARWECKFWKQFLFYSYNSQIWHQSQSPEAWARCRRELFQSPMVPLDSLSTKRHSKRKSSTSVVTLRCNVEVPILTFECYVSGPFKHKVGRIHCWSTFEFEFEFGAYIYCLLCMFPVAPVRESGPDTEKGSLTQTSNS